MKEIQFATGKGEKKHLGPLFFSGNILILFLDGLRNLKKLVKFSSGGGGAHKVGLAPLVCAPSVRNPDNWQPS